MGVVVNFFLNSLALPVLLASAGTIYWINGWVYFGFTFGYLIAYTLLLMRINPSLLNERGKFIKEGTKPFDKVYVVLHVPLTYLILIISGLDAVRYQWSSVPLWIILLGVVVTVPAYYLSLWAMAVNSYFECTVRIQEHQRVCKSGPYRIVRHPGYASGIISVLAAPLILGSWWGLAPGAIAATMFVVRTELEDRTLQKELAGYNEYTKSTRYRLIPLIW
jgi:protein-S-isoprenylcysteine O-methyltransferase Ste14